MGERPNDNERMFDEIAEELQRKAPPGLTLTIEVGK